DGYLIHYSFDETNQILDSGPQTPAVLKLSLSVPRATFTMVEGSTTNHIMPPDSHISRSFSAKLAQRVLAQAMYLQHVETLNDPEAQTILNEITQYLTEAGESLGDESLKRAAALLLKNLSTDAET
ncbi:MAG TPA: hypothetical protein VLG09_04135, partial [Candidatus Saccharimonadales bacterium]|nr:hypothetical protein [Candidatus Saccharimonadales bacterium]